MKNFIYFFIIATLFLVACGPVGPTDETPIFSVKYFNADGQLVALENGQTIEISKLEPTATDLLFKGFIYYEESFNLEITVTRERVEGTTDDFCLDVCIPGNGKLTQNFTFDIDDPSGESSFEASFKAETEGDYKIVYDFHELGKPNANIKVTVIYKYRS